MARGRGPLLILASLALAGGAAWMAQRWVAARATPSQRDTVSVVTAAMDLPLGTKLEPRHLATMQLIPGQEPKNAFHDAHELEGKVTSMQVTGGQMLVSAMFAADGQAGALAGIVARDKRAVTVRVDDVVGVAGFLLPGNRVDVVATRKDEHSNGVIADTILSNIKVLAVDQTAAANSNEPVVVRAVTLEVSPDEAEILLKGKAAGSIQLALRNPLDESDSRHVPEPAKVVVRNVVVRAPVATEPTVTVIRGTKVGHEVSAVNSNVVR